MNLYEIDSEILKCINEETGEITDFEMFNQLQIDRNVKIENIACYIKNLESDAEQIKLEIKSLTEREKVASNKADKLKTYLSEILQGEKFSSPKVAVTFRASQIVEVDEKFIEWAKKNAKKYLSYSEPKVDKAFVKDEIKSGKTFKFARIVDKKNISIK